MNPKHLFILCPPASGSTLLWRLLQTSPRVSALPAEGQSLVPDILFGPDRWNPELPVPWAEVEKNWRSVWDLGKPVLLEKSPPHLVRAGQLERHFPDSHFVVMVRNPYAFCEGLKRRWRPEMPYGEIARLWAEWAGHQASNLGRLRRTLAMTYEELTGDPGRECRRLVRFLPELESLDPDRIFLVLGRAQKIESLNPAQIARLSPGDLREIEAVLSSHADLMRRFGYARLGGPDA